MPKPLWAPWRLEYVQGAADAAEAPCIFCEPNDDLLVHRGEVALVLMNKFPYALAHVMVAPLRHVGDYSRLTEAEVLEIHKLARATLGALAAEYRPHGFNLGWNLGRPAGAGIVDHVHMHVVPRWTGDTNFMPVLADTRVLPEALVESARRLRASWPDA
jgi:ATP adenylyltransferase